MIRPLRFLDALYLSSISGPSTHNWAETRERLVSQEGDNLSTLQLLRRSLLSQRRSACRVYREDSNLAGVISARARPNSRVWEVDLLYLDPKRKQECQELLEEITIHAGRQGGQRLVLRLPAGSPFLTSAHKAGFVACLQETLYRSNRRLPLRAITDLQPRRRQPSDDYPLFRLYNTVVPSRVRSVQAMVLNQWKEWQESAPGSKEELVWEAEGSIVAWLLLQTYSSESLGELLVHPRWEEHLPFLVDYAIGKSGNRRVTWLVPAYQVSLARRLEERFFTAEGEYILLVKPLTAPLRQQAAVPAGA